MSEEQLVNRFARIYLQAAQSHGHDLETILNQSNIRPTKFANAPFNMAQLIELSRQVKLLMQDEFVGLTKSGCKLGAFDTMVELALSAPSLIDALHKVFRFYSLLSSDITFSLTLEGTNAVIEVSVSKTELDPENFLCEWWLLNWWSLSSWLVGEKIPCLRFEFPHPPAIDESEYFLSYATECRFSQPGARLLFDKKYLTWPVVKDAQNYSEFFMPREKFGEIPGTTENITPRLRKVLMTYFAEHREFPSLNYAAGQCHLSAQTLRRRLLGEGLSFRGIKENIRRDIILKLLRKPTIPLVDVTRLGGFAELSSLGRAVKNWTGLYPRQYRDQTNSSH